MSRYIDVDALKDDLIHNRCFYPAIVDSAIRDTPTADVVEVVRCKDCKYGTLCYGEIKCTVDEENFGLILYHEPHHFCSYGERREG